MLSPTRELASQIADSFRAYAAGMPLLTAVVFGGVPIGEQEREVGVGGEIELAHAEAAEGDDHHLVRELVIGRGGRRRFAGVGERNGVRG